MAKLLGSFIKEKKGPFKEGMCSFYVRDGENLPLIGRALKAYGYNEETFIGVYEGETPYNLEAFVIQKRMNREYKKEKKESSFIKRYFYYNQTTQNGLNRQNRYVIDLIHVDVSYAMAALNHCYIEEWFVSPSVMRLRKKNRDRAKKICNNNITDKSLSIKMYEKISTSNTRKDSWIALICLDEKERIHVFPDTYYSYIDDTVNWSLELDRDRSMRECSKINAIIDCGISLSLSTDYSYSSYLRFNHMFITTDILKQRIKILFKEIIPKRKPTIALKVEMMSGTDYLCVISEYKNGRPVLSALSSLNSASKLRTINVPFSIDFFNAIAACLDFFEKKQSDVYRGVHSSYNMRVQYIPLSDKEHIANSNTCLQLQALGGAL